MKKTIFIDFDDTLVNATEAFVKVYNKRYEQNADYSLVRRLDLTDQCPLLGTNDKFQGNIQQEIVDIYASKEFWDNLKPFPSAIDVLNKFKKEGYRLILVSMGNLENLTKKKHYMEVHFPMFNDVILWHQTRFPFSKGVVVTMNRAFMIDDNSNVLRTTNATEKIIFGQEREYNSKYNYTRIDNWLEIYDYISSKIEKNKKRKERKNEK